MHTNSPSICDLRFDARVPKLLLDHSLYRKLGIVGLSKSTLLSWNSIIISELSTIISEIYRLVSCRSAISYLLLNTALRRL